MALGIHQNYIDFTILETGNTKTLVFLDSSQYMMRPEKPILEVLLPGHTKYFLVNIIPYTFNTFNSNTLGLELVTGDSCLADLPDGVYTLKYKVCPYEYNHKTKFFLRTTALNNRLKMIFTRKDDKILPPVEDAELNDGIVNILLGIEAGKAYAEQGNAAKATTFYNLAFKQADRILKLLGLTCAGDEHCNLR